MLLLSELFLVLTEFFFLRSEGIYLMIIFVLLCFLFLQLALSLLRICLVLRQRLTQICFALRLLFDAAEFELELLLFWVLVLVRVLEEDDVHHLLEIGQLLIMLVLARWRIEPHTVG